MMRCVGPPGSPRDRAHRSILEQPYKAMGTIKPMGRWRPPQHSRPPSCPLSIEPTRPGYVTWLQTVGRFPIRHRHSACHTRPVGMGEVLGVIQ